MSATQAFYIFYMAVGGYNLGFFMGDHASNDITWMTWASLVAALVMFICAYIEVRKGLD